jgi:sugar lactone lactonase YvrE
MTLTFLFADIRDYTSYVEQHGDAQAGRLIADFRKMVRAQLAATGGGEVKTEGDSFYLVFRTAGQAVRCGAAILREAELRTGSDRALRVGVGIHAGEPIPLERQYVGSAVNLAARIGSAAESGELLISDTVRGLLRTSGLPPLTEHAPMQLKGIQDVPRVFSVDWHQMESISAGEDRRGRRAFIPKRLTGLGAFVGRRSLVLGVAVLLSIGLVAFLTIPRTVTTLPSSMVRVAGLGTAGFSGDGGPATAAQLDRPISLAFDKDGNLYIADSTQQLNTAGQFEGFTRIRRIDRAGKIQTVAGGGILSRYTSDYAPAVHLEIEGSIAIDVAGVIYVSQPDEPVYPQFVAAIDSGFRFQVFAGSFDGAAGYAGDGGPATGAKLNQPRGVAVDSTGNVYIADSRNNVIREVRRDLTIDTVAGDGKPGNSGDGGNAKSAELDAPVGVAISPDGSLFIADTNNHRVRRIDHGGNIVLFAGSGRAAFGGDGGPATAADLNLPTGLAFDSAGNVYIADSGNNRVRKVAPDGTITTIAGDGTPGVLGGPSAVAVSPSGVLFIADTENHRVVKLLGG